MNLLPGRLAALRFRHLALIEALVRCGSLRKAARQLHMSQPSATAALQDLEAALGRQLFTRARQGVQLTPAGTIAVSRMRATLGEVGMLAAELSSAEQRARLRIGAVQQAYFGVLARLMPRLRARCGCTVQLIDGTSAELARMLQDSRVDCLLSRVPEDFIRALRPAEYVYEPLYTTGSEVVASPSHRLAKQRRVTLQELSAEAWVLPKEGSLSRDAIARALAAEGLPGPDIVLETSSFLFTVPLLAAGDCVSVLPRDPALAHQRQGVVKILNVRLPQISSPVAFVARRAAMSNPNIRAVLEETRALVNETGKFAVIGEGRPTRSRVFSSQAAQSSKAPAGPLRRR